MWLIETTQMSLISIQIKIPQLFSKKGLYLIDHTSHILNSVNTIPTQKY